MENYYRHVPNGLTISRILMIPLIVCTFFFDDVKFAHQLGGVIFFAAGCTDFLDGYLARKYKLQSAFGEMFDPIADKILVMSVMVMLIYSHRVYVAPCLLILAREFTIAGLREFLGQIRVSVPVTNIAKIKTATQMFALFILIIGNKGSGYEHTEDIGNCLLWIAAILTIFTGFSYYKSTMQYITQNAQ